MDPTPAFPSYRVARPKLVGGALCLDFVNTVEWRGAPEPAERLTSYAELLIWAEAAGAIDRNSRARIERAAQAKPAEAAAALREAIELRETIADLFAAHAPRPLLLSRLNEWLAHAPERKRLAYAAGRYAWAAPDRGGEFEAPLWPVVWSAADLLVSGRASRVRSCADRRCAWMFLDASRARPRRWCSMKSCGNRAKARRHYRRRRAA